MGGGCEGMCVHARVRSMMACRDSPRKCWDYSVLHEWPRLASELCSKI